MQKTNKQTTNINTKIRIQLIIKTNTHFHSNFLSAKSTTIVLDRIYSTPPLFPLPTYPLKFAPITMVNGWLLVMPAQCECSELFLPIHPITDTVTEHECI